WKNVRVTIQDPTGATSMIFNRVLLTAPTTAPSQPAKMTPWHTFPAGSGRPRPVAKPVAATTTTTAPAQATAAHPVTGNPGATVAVTAPQPKPVAVTTPQRMPVAVTTPQPKPVAVATPLPTPVVGSANVVAVQPSPVVRGRRAHPVAGHAHLARTAHP